MLGTARAAGNRLHVAEHRRQPDRTHLHKLGLDTSRYGDDRCCDHGYVHRLLRCCADDGERVACDVVTFDLMESRRAECSEPFDGCFVVLARPMPARAVWSLSAEPLHPHSSMRCCSVQSLVLSRSKAASLATIQPDEPSWDLA